MKILLCCAGGFSTNMLMQNMKKVVKQSEKLNEADFDSLEGTVENWDIVLVGPQIAHKIDFIKSILTPLDIPYAIIDKDVYGEMDGATVMKLALVTYKKHQLSKQK